MTEMECVCKQNCVVSLALRKIFALTFRCSDEAVRGLYKQVADLAFEGLLESKQVEMDWMKANKEAL